MMIGRTVSHYRILEKTRHGGESPRPRVDMIDKTVSPHRITESNDRGGEVPAAPEMEQ